MTTIFEKPMLAVAIDRDAEKSVNAQIAQEILDLIRWGTLRPGMPLPGSRDLASQLGVNRKTVVIVYEELTAQGWLETRGKRGTFVSAALPRMASKASSAPAVMPAEPMLAEPGYRAYGKELIAPSVAPDSVLAFNDGIPDTRVVPFEPLSKAFRKALIESARGNHLGYGDPRGLPILRQALASMLRANRGLPASEETLCVVRGSQMGIYVTAKILVRPGDAVALEKLTYPPAREAFRSCGAEIFSVDQDEYGMVPSSLESICRKSAIRAIYITPHHQFPTTVTMPIERRMRLLALAEQFNFVIVEDDYDHEFHFRHNPMLPMASFDRGGRVIYIGSLSKVLAPGLRVGYVMAPSTIIGRLANEIMLIDRQGNGVTERAVAELLQNGELSRHIRRAVRIYGDRQAHALSLVKERLAGFATVRAPDGGLALWLTVAEDIDMGRLESDARRAGTEILPGALFTDGNTPVNAIRLGFGSLHSNELDEAFRRLRSAFECHRGSSVPRSR